MTTFSTVFGMIPLATTGGEGAEFRGSMGIIIIGGLLTSMFLTLLIVPVAYSLMDAGQSALLGLIERARGCAAAFVTRAQRARGARPPAAVGRSRATSEFPRTGVELPQ